MLTTKEIEGGADRGNGWAFVGLLVLGSVRVKRDCKNASLNRQQQDVWLLKESSQVHTRKAAHTPMYRCTLKTQIACKWADASHFLIRLYTPSLPQQTGHVLRPRSIVVNSAIDSQCCALSRY